MAGLWVAVLVSSFSTATTLALGEIAAYTSRFAPRLFATGQLTALRLGLPGVAAGHALRSALWVVGLSWLLLRLAKQHRRLRSSSDLALVVALVFGVSLGALFASVAGRELYYTGVATEILAALLLLLVYVHSCMRGALTALVGPARGAPTSARQLAIALVSWLTLPLDWLPGRLRRALLRKPARYFAFQGAGAAIWTGALLWISYPQLEDFRTHFLPIALHAALAVAMLGGVCLWFAVRPAPASPRTGLLLGAALALIATLSGAWRPLPPARSLVIHEYSRLTAELHDGWIRRLRRLPGRWGRTPGTAELDLSVSTPRPARAAPLVGQTPPIVVILWDAARPDHLGCYGYGRPTSPAADRLAGESVLFERAYSMSTATTCGIRHLFAGRYTSRNTLATDHAPFFVHALRAVGYREFFLTATGTRVNGVSFESFLENGPPPEQDGSRFVHLQKDPALGDSQSSDRAMVDALLATWFEHLAAGGAPGLKQTFSFLHLTGCHSPWENVDPLRDFGADPVARYDGEMAKVDALTGEVFAALAELGAWEDAVIVLVADHGTALLDHGRWSGFLPYEEQLRVPLLIKAPGIEPARSTRVAATIDLGPTLLGLFGMALEDRHGADLLAGGSADAAAWSRPYLFSLAAFDDAYTVLEDGTLKLYYHRDQGYAALFDLAVDPGEQHNLIATRPDAADRLGAILNAFLWQGRASFATPHFYAAPEE